MTTNIKSELKQIAAHLPAKASYEDAMYELYVHMKVDQGRKSADAGRVMDHEIVKQKFLK